MADFGSLAPDDKMPSPQWREPAIDQFMALFGKRRADTSTPGYVPPPSQMHAQQTGDIGRGAANALLFEPGRALGETLKRIADGQGGFTDYADAGAGVAGAIPAGAAAKGAALFLPMATRGLKTAEAVAPVKGIRAYHGSPHDFDRFDMSKIGTGEGAQAYGHGLYFAENEGTAQSYRDALRASRSKTPDDIISLPPPMRMAVAVHANTARPPMEAAKWAQNMDSSLRGMDQTKVADMIERFRDAKRGRMYEVNIKAQPEEFLDWDKPLSGQAPDVRNAAYRAAGNYNPDNSVQSLIESLAVKLHRQGLGHLDNALASKALNEAGIPGIKYLDQGSRNQTRWVARHPEGGVNDFADEASARAFVGRNPEHSLEAPKQSFNYVVNDDSLIDIMRKYGLAAGVPMAGAAALANGDSNFGSLSPQ